jgi:homotetrameric cytidine deaminase
VADTISQRDPLIAAARAIRDRAHAPYSHFAVGAALLLRDGRIVTGVNVENASYGLTVCAERNAIGTAVAGGDVELAAVAVVTRDGNVGPCGACRQVLWEFRPRDGAPVPVWIAGESADVAVVETSLAALLPGAFDDRQL